MDVLSYSWLNARRFYRSCSVGIYMKSIAFHRTASGVPSHHISRTDAESRVRLGVCRWLSKTSVVAIDNQLSATTSEARQSGMRSVWHVAPSAGYLGWQMRRNRVQ